MKKILILFSVLLIVFLIIVYVRHVPKLSGEYIEKISVIVHSEYGVKQYYIRAVSYTHLDVYKRQA